MLINVRYNKTSGEISLDNDIKDIFIELSQSSIEDNEDSLYFEIAVDTSSYEMDLGEEE